MSIKTWLANITGASTSTDQFSKQQVNFFGKDASAAMIFPYGFFANVSDGELSFLTVVGESTESKVNLGQLLKVRPDIEQDEVTVYHPKTGSVIKFANGGDIEITTATNITVNCAEANVTATGNVNVTATTVAVTGNMTISGTLDVTGAITGAEVTAGSTVLTTHTHSQPNDGGGNTEADTSAPL